MDESGIIISLQHFSNELPQQKVF